ncbi:MAG: hypothetical protein JRH20_22510 [Deltaproteobacteria bacterium]|nr:hypothetical protein [Deltaproteobacteria bacterium]
MSAISRLQTMYDLFNAHPAPNERVARTIDAWQERTNLRLPRALRDFYATECTISLGLGKSPWVLPTNELWAEFSQVPPPTLDELLSNIVDAHSSRPHALFSQWDMLPLPTQNPLAWIETDVMRVWHGFVELDGSDDPPVWVHCRDSTHASTGWTRATEDHGPVDSNCFSSFMYMLVATSYVADQSPWSFFGPETDWSTWDDGSEFAYDTMSELVKPYENGLWLRAREPSSAGVMDLLLKSFPAGQRWDLAGDVATHEFLPEQGRIWVTIERPESGGISSWWIYAWTADRLFELAQPLWNFETLAGTLHADHGSAQAVLKRLSDHA